jgi:stage V sporulation protein B
MPVSVDLLTALKTGNPCCQSGEVMSKNQKSFIAGAAILGGIGLIVKVIGAIFRIPLGNIVGSVGMANYQVAYPVYAALVVISTAGLPTAISRMVSERVSVGDYKGAHRVFLIAFRVLLVIGVVTTGVMLLISKTVANSVQVPTAWLSLMMIAPALFFVSILSAYRGYFQGLQMMWPTAISQLIEQVVKLVAGLYLAYLLLPRGVEWGAAGALIGITISEVAALLFVVVIYQFKRRNLKEKRGMLPNSAYQAQRSIGMDLLVIALPIALGGCIMPAINIADTAIVTRSLMGIGYTNEAAQASFGVLTAFVNPLINMPAVLSVALCMSLVPAISAARAQNNPEPVSIRSAMGLKLSILVGLPCAAGMYILAGPIMNLLYSGGLTPDEMMLGTELLQTLSIGVFFLTLLQSMTGILQGAGHQFIPLFNLLIGAVIKVVLSLALIPKLGVQGAAIGTAVCYAVAAALNTIFMIYFTKPKVRIVSGLLMPLLATAAMGAAAYFLYDLLIASLSNGIATLAAIAAAAIVYFGVLLVTGGLRKNDLRETSGRGRAKADTYSGVE